jgi:hypothetical protein
MFSILKIFLLRAYPKILRDSPILAAADIAIEE